MIFDSGWLFLGAGLVVLAAVVLVPAHDSLEQHRAQSRAMNAQLDVARLRIERYADFIAAVDREEPTVIRRLAAAELNLSDPNRETVLVSVTPNRSDVQRWIEPQPARTPEFTLPNTHLRRLTRNPAVRPWLIAGAGLCVLVGLLPPTRRSRSGGVERSDDADISAASA
ncbi:MAG: hypothetical protein KAS72_15260 [Phycisphaerales bacterium]|nr:hypothetical protein [Phycisphaerales bacterium]